MKKCSLFCANIYLRHVYFSPFLRKSLFNQRYKKIVILLCYIGFIILFNCIFYTFDSSVKFDLSNLIIMKLLVFAGYSAFSVVLSGIFVLPVISILNVRNKELYRLYEEISRNKSLDLVKQVKIVKGNSLIYTALSFLLIIGILFFELFYVVGFCAVWSEWQLTIILGFSLALILDMFVFEILIEAFLIWMFNYRETNECFNKIHYYLTVYRHFRAMS